MANVYAVIMAGGISERFWPLGTPERPKQFLGLIGGKSFLRATVERLRPRLPLSHQLIVAGRAHADLVRGELPELPEENLILEPIGRNTAACLGLASLQIERRDPLAILIALPADHDIPDEKPFLTVLEQAVAAAEGRDGSVVIGIRPDRPETGYGYMRKGSRIGEGLYHVLSFHEKPDRSTAERFLASGDFYWNSGIFLWRNRVLQALLERHLPAHWRKLCRIRAALETDRYQEVVEEVYAELEAISIDKGVLEKAEGTVMLIGEFGWDDIGTWAALERIFPADASGNVVVGRHLGVDTTDCVIYSSGRVIGTVGLKGLIIVETEQGVLICPKDRGPEVRRIARLTQMEKTSSEPCS